MNPIIFILYVVLTAGILLLLVTALPAINQLKALLKDLEKTSAEARVLVIQMKSLTEKVEKDVEKVDAILEASRETVTTVSSSLKMINKSMVAKSAGVFAIIPAIKFGWDLVRKFRGGKGK
ncbi:MAG: hypothetical protein GY765_22385 [bacterium]|nr:hypothetical protein [bacterium]